MTITLSTVTITAALGAALSLWGLGFRTTIGLIGAALFITAGVSYLA